MKTSLVHRVRTLLRSESEGSALVEMAVTLPLVLLIMTGIFSFSVALYQKLQLAEAVSNAGHYLATSRGDHDPCANAVNAVTSGAPALQSSAITITLTLGGTTLPSTCPGSGTSAASSTFSSANGQTVSVGAASATGLAVFGTNYSVVTLDTGLSEVVQ
jgi:Flp pilus assembly protein TadG